MKSSDVTGGQVATAQQYDDLRRDAYGGSQLLVHQQATPGMTVYVENGVCFVGTTKVAFAGGNSPTFTAPVSNPRIDLLVISSAGALSIVQGTEAASPVAPAYSEVKLTLAEIYNVVGETQIYDNDKQIAGQGYIKTDARPLLNTRPASIASSGNALNTTYTNNSGRPQLHIVTGYVSLTGGASGRVTSQFYVGVVQVDEHTIYGSQYMETEFVHYVIVPAGATYRYNVFASGNAAVNNAPAIWYIVTL